MPKGLLHHRQVPTCDGLIGEGDEGALQSFLLDPPHLGHSSRIGVLSHLRTFLPGHFADAALLLIHDDPSLTGSMSVEFGDRLVRAIRQGDLGQDCAFMVWSGYDYGGFPAWEPGRVAEFGGRSFYVYWGQVGQWSEPASQRGELPPYLTPSYWVALNHRWILVSDIDANFSLLALRDMEQVDIIRSSFHGAQIVESDGC